MFRRYSQEELRACIVHDRARNTHEPKRFFYALARRYRACQANLCGVGGNENPTRGAAVLRSTQVPYLTSGQPAFVAAYWAQHFRNVRCFFSFPLIPLRGREPIWGGAEVHPVSGLRELN